MSIIYNSGVSLTGVSAAGTTGTAADLLAGATAITAVTGEQELITGTMANVGAINVTYTISSVGGSYTYTFPNNIYTTGGTITVNENIPTKSAQTYYISSSDQIISAGLFLTGDQTIAAVDPLYTTNYMPTTYNIPRSKRNKLNKSNIISTPRRITYL